MSKHNSLSFSSHRRILSTFIKPQITSRISSHKRSKSNYHHLSLSPLSKYIDSNINNCKNDIQPLQIIEKYNKESFIMNNHEQLMKNLCFTSTETKNNLEYNYLHINEQLCASDQTHNFESLIFRIYETLNQIDKQIIQDIFQQEKNQINSFFTDNKPKNHFRSDTLMKIIDLLSDLISNIIKFSTDQTIAKAIEQFWKFFVIIIDLNMQWQSDRYEQILQEQHDDLLEQIQHLKHEINIIKETSLLQQKQSQEKLQSEQKKCFILREEKQNYFQKYCDLEEQLAQFTDIESANKDIKQIHSTVREMDFKILKANQELLDSQRNISYSLKSLGKMLTTKPSNKKSLNQIKYHQLHLKYIEPITKNYFTINPLITLLDLNLEEQQKEQCKIQQFPKDFINFLLSNINLFPYTSGSEMYQFWTLQDNYFFTEQRIILLIKLSEQNSDIYYKIVQEILGINKDIPISYKVLEETIKFIKLVNTTLLLKQQNRPSIMTQSQNNNVNLEQEFELQIISKLINPTLEDKIQLSLTEKQKKQISLIEIGYEFLLFTEQQEKEKWQILTLNFTQNNHLIILIYFQQKLVLYKIWELIIIHLNNDNNQNTKIIEDILLQIHLIWLYHPRCLTKPSFDLINNYQQTPSLTKSSTLQRQTPLIKKQNTLLSESQKRK